MPLKACRTCKIITNENVCPVCKRTAVKVGFEVQVKEKTIKVCKTCKAAISHGKLQKEAEALVPAT